MDAEISALLKMLSAFSLIERMLMEKEKPEVKVRLTMDTRLTLFVVVTKREIETVLVSSDMVHGAPSDVSQSDGMSEMEILTGSGRPDETCSARREPSLSSFTVYDAEDEALINSLKANAVKMEAFVPCNSAILP